ncbi:branched-chain amino acid ABC transporter permease [Enterovirga rhinocerotis]|uniref:Branched-chain amino acid transport system permease protein n=1 Tax=Enterovirga rhinocerotis TaxID=1339210 RepID=A0A4R7C753_9HYPH|nr:branched-chain amino acid ABC transporter permease [Enterovirga rhinocerotis]TDR94091.1 branched-chain amino acid transport system permease protein [Enterovirga rhinocerotis]
MDALFLAEVMLAGIGSGALYALTGVAFVLIYKATRVVNLAIGEILMLGGYAFLGFAAGLGLPAIAALVLAVVTGGLLGWLVERSLIRPMLGESPISVFMVTIGLGSILVGLVQLGWGADPLRLPEFMPATPVFIGDAYLAPKVAVGFVAAAVVIAAFLALFRFSRSGVALKATAGDQGAAYSVGIDVPRVFSAAWILACATAAGAGVLVGAIGGISPTMGVFGLSVLVVVIIGGLDSIAGALVGGLLIGLVEALAGAFLGGEYKLVVTFTLLLLLLMVRPYGLFGTHEIERL